MDWSSRGSEVRGVECEGDGLPEGEEEEGVVLAE